MNFASIQTDLGGHGDATDRGRAAFEILRTIVHLSDHVPERLFSLGLTQGYAIGEFQGTHLEAFMTGAEGHRAAERRTVEMVDVLDR